MSDPDKMKQPTEHDDEEDYEHVEQGEGVEVIENANNEHADIEEDEDIEENEDNEAIEFDAEDNSVITISHHQGSVFCIDSHDDLVASGGEDDKAYVWQLNNDENKLERFTLLFECEKFADSVTNVKFSSDGKYLAVCDYSGKIRVYSITRGADTAVTLAMFWSHDLEADVELIKWHPGCNVLFVGTNDGYFWMFKISTNEIKVMYAGDQAKLSCFEFLKDGINAICCYSNGTVRIWDLKSSTSVHNLTHSHEGDILCIDLSTDGHIFATGGEDMKIRLHNASNGKFIVDLVCPTSAKKEGDMETEGDNENSIESIAFCRTLPLLACATLKGELLIWDLNSYSIRNKIEVEAGFSKVVWSSTSERLFASTLDGELTEYDGRDLNLPAKSYLGHRAEVLDFCINEQHSYLASASNDGTVKIFEFIKE